MDHVGIDVHQKYSEVCVLTARGKVKKQVQIPTTEAALGRLFRRRSRSRIVFECGPSSPWVYRLLREWGHEVVVVNPRKVRLIAESTLKSDRIDAEILARLSRFDGGLLHSVYQRSDGAQLLRTRLRVRRELVRSRTRLINSVRGSLRAQGYRVASCEARVFALRFAEVKVAEELRYALDPLLEAICGLNEQIDRLNRELKELSSADELMMRLQSAPGVGPVVSIAFVAWMDRPERFKQSRDVGACLGIRPRVRGSGGKIYHGRITREGDKEMRSLLVQAAHAAMHSKKDAALLRWAKSLEERVGKHKAVVALARKISIILHRIWVTGNTFRPFPQGV